MDAAQIPLTLPSPQIRLDGVHKRHPNGLLALQDLTLQVQAGEFVSLLGPSGCGKSTVLRLAAGLDTASGGVVDVPGVNDHAASASSADGPAPSSSSPATEHRAETAFVFQEPTLMPWASVFDNVWLPLRLAGVARAEAAPRIAQALASVGLADFAAARPHELSGGMKMRASIARALVTRPHVLLMDEPFAALDEFTRQRLNADLLAWWQQHRLTVLFVTHSVLEAVFLSQRVLVMSARPGRVFANVAIDAPAVRDLAWRTSPHYAARCAEVTAAVEAAHGGEATPARTVEASSSPDAEGRG